MKTYIKTTIIMIKNMEIINKNNKAEKHKEKFYFLLGEHNTGLAQKFIVQKYRNTSNLLLFN